MAPATTSCLLCESQRFDFAETVRIRIRSLRFLTESTVRVVSSAVRDCTASVCAWPVCHFATYSMQHNVRPRCQHNTVSDGHSLPSPTLTDHDRSTARISVVQDVMVLQDRQSSNVVSLQTKHAAI